jgi:hypothetical protein
VSAWRGKGLEAQVSVRVSRHFVAFLSLYCAADEPTAR